MRAVLELAVTVVAAEAAEAVLVIMLAAQAVRLAAAEVPGVLETTLVQAEMESFVCGFTDERNN